MKKKKIHMALLFLGISVFLSANGLTVSAESVSENTVLNEIEPDELISVSDSVSENIIQAGTATPANPLHHCDGGLVARDYTDFSYIYFGTYPQTEITDKRAMAAIDKAIEANGIVADKGIDVWINGIKYKRISMADASNNEEFGTSAFRYFRWEKIKWKVLENDGNTLFIMADQALDCKRYYDKGYFTFDKDGWVREERGWENGTIREWLNDDFYHGAFSENEQKAIKACDIENAGNPHSDVNKKDLEKTEDHIFLLSLNEIINPSYGFCSNADNPSEGRMVRASNYAHVRGCQVDEEGNDYVFYWLRTPGSGSDTDASYVRKSGQVAWWGTDVADRTVGVVPVMRISYSSKEWGMTKEGIHEDWSQGEDSKPPAPKDIKVQKLTVTGSIKKPAAGKKIKLGIKVTPSNASNQAVTWKSSNKKYATVDKSGKVTLKKAGAGKTVTITATAVDGSNVKASYKMKIMKHAVKKITLKAPERTLKAGSSMTIKASVRTTGKQANKALKWTSSNKKYASVNKKGKIKAKKAGKGKTVIITATATDGSNKKAKVKIKIK